jgi:hypothetical protein
MTSISVRITAQDGLDTWALEGKLSHTTGIPPKTPGSHNPLPFRMLMGSLEDQLIEKFDLKSGEKLGLKDNRTFKIDISTKIVKK